MTRIQTDPATAVRDWLRTQSIGADQVELVVSTGWMPRTGTLLIVSDDGGPVLLPVKSQHTIRLTGYADGRTKARRIATLAAGKLAESRPRPAGIAYVDPDMGAVLDARDKETGAWLASVLVTVQARTVEV